MFQLYKQRDFSAIINDTFLFFRSLGKNYFRNYFILNGAFLIVLIVLMYILGNFFVDSVMSSVGTSRPSSVVEDYFSNNLTFFIIAAVLIAVIAIIFSLLSFSFPVIYMKAYETKEVPETRDLLNLLKEKAGKIIKFALLSLITFVPISFIAMLVSALLIVIIIGIPIFIIVFAALSCWIFLSFYDYLTTDNDYFTAMGNGYKILTNKFWVNVGSTVIFYLIVYIVQAIISFIPYIFGMASMFTEMDSDPNNIDFSFIGIMMMVTMALSTLLSFILTNLTMVNHGIIYYSSKEEQINHSVMTEIDLIGRDE